MILENFIEFARKQGASDLHLEPGLALAIRVRGELHISGEPVAAAVLLQAARELIADDWPIFLERQSYDLSRVVGHVRCRFNIFRTARGVAFAVRLLMPFAASLKTLNLHPDLARLTEPTHGLVIVSGPTGSGKTSTLAALISEINLREARHILTIESPIEYALPGKKSFIRQREVGRDTPSFEQALIDAMREDPDVLMVGEMRDPRTMQLTLNASETGHLVLATLHSATASEALQRIVSAFPAEIQPSICAQLADSLVGVICQHLVFRPTQNILVPECEILFATTGVKSVVRQGAFSKLQVTLEAGGQQEGNITWARYRDWLNRKNDFFIPTLNTADVVNDLPPTPLLPKTSERQPAIMKKADTSNSSSTQSEPATGVIVIEDEDDPQAILSELEKK